MTVEYDDALTVWTFKSKDEAAEFESKINGLHGKWRLAYEKYIGTYSADEAFKELKQWYSIDEDDDEESA